MTQFISTYGVWLAAALIALETIGLPLPAEAVLMATAAFAGTTHAIDISLLIPLGIAAAAGGNVIGYWIGRKFGYRLLLRYGERVRLTRARLSIGQYLFAKHGGKLVFVARFLPILRNMAALLAGVNCMPARRFYFASSAAAAGWVTFHSLTSYCFGEAYAQLAPPAAVALSVAAIAVVLAAPALILRCEPRLQAAAERASAPPLPRS